VPVHDRPLGGVGRLTRRLWAAGSPSPTSPTAPPGSGGLTRRLDEVLRAHPGAFRQQSSTTCGSSSLAMFRVLTDRTFAGARLDTAPEGASRRWAALEQSVQLATNRARRASGGLRAPWPRALGTPPWGLRDALDDLGRDRGVRFALVRVDGSRAEQVDAALDRVAAAVTRGVPVPLYVGDRVLPRHVVLAVAAGPTAIELYDPAHGGRRRVQRTDLRAARAGVSGWDLLWGAVVPR
jgi:hypothetical protein